MHCPSMCMLRGCCCLYDLNVAPAPHLDKDGSMLVPRDWHLPRRRCPLPPPVSVPCQAVCIPKRRAIGIAAATQQQQAVRARCCSRIHPDGGGGYIIYIGKLDTYCVALHCAAGLTYRGPGISPTFEI